jgi:hypothetical protein
MPLQQAHYLRTSDAFPSATGIADVSLYCTKNKAVGAELEGSTVLITKSAIGDDRDIVPSSRSLKVSDDGAL